MSQRALSFTRDKWWLAANFFGAVVFLWLSSKTWIEQALRGEDVALTGEAAVWFSTAFPVFVGFVLADFVWFIRRVRHDQSRQPMLLAAILWVVAFGVNQLLS